MLRVVFCGTPDIAVPTLEELARHPLVEIVSVVSQPDRPAGRGNQLKSPEVVVAAKHLNLAVHQSANINRDEEFLKQLESDPPDLFIVFAFAQFLGKRVLNIPRRGCFNIHTSLLPRHRGAAPIHYGIWKGDRLGGVSIQRMVKQMDAGDVCFAAETPIHPTDTTPILYDRLKSLAAQTIDPFITAMAHDRLVFQAQEESQASFAPTIKKEDGFIDPLKHSAVEIERRVRAFQPWPGVQIMLGDKRCKLLEVNVASHTVAPGQLKRLGRQLFLGCHDSCLEVLRLQPEGKAPLGAGDWLNGQQAELPTIKSLAE